MSTTETIALTTTPAQSTTPAPDITNTLALVTTTSTGTTTTSLITEGEKITVSIGTTTLAGQTTTQQISGDISSLRDFLNDPKNIEFKNAMIELLELHNQVNCSYKESEDYKGEEECVNLLADEMKKAHIAYNEGVRSNLLISNKDEFYDLIKTSSDGRSLEGESFVNAVKGLKDVDDNCLSGLDPKLGFDYKTDFEGLLIKCLGYSIKTESEKRAEAAAQLALTARNVSAASALDAKNARDEAQGARDDAQEARDDAQEARDGAQEAAQAAEAEKYAAAALVTVAEEAAQLALTARNVSAAERYAAAASALDAKNARDEAQGARDGAQEAAQAAEAERYAAAASALDAKNARDEVLEVLLKTKIEMMKAENRSLALLNEIKEIGRAHV